MIATPATVLNAPITNAKPVTHVGTPLALSLIHLSFFQPRRWGPLSKDDREVERKVRRRRTLIKNGHVCPVGGFKRQTAEVMDDVIEMNLTQAVNVTNTEVIRSKLAEMAAAHGRVGPPVELVRFHVFIHCTEGRGSHMVDFEDHELEPGTALWIRPGQVQRWSELHANFSADVVVFESSALPDLPLFDRFAGVTAAAHLGSDSMRLQQQTQWMADDLEVNDDHPTAAAVVGVILRLFARQAHGNRDQAASTAERLTAAFVESVERNIHQRAVGWHAQRVGASSRTVARATAQTFRQRPKEIIDARVILEAQRRLAWSDQDISTIARELRFSEPSNFTKFFRSRTGMSPSDFRESVLVL